MKEKEEKSDARRSLEALLSIARKKGSEALKSIDDIDYAKTVKDLKNKTGKTIEDIENMSEGDFNKYLEKKSKELDKLAENTSKKVERGWGILKNKGASFLKATREKLEDMNKEEVAEKTEE